MRSLLIFILTCGFSMTLFSMHRVGTSNDELENTAYFKSDSPTESPRSIVLELGDVPRIATSFLHAFMCTYEVDEKTKIITFPDYLEQKKRCTIQLSVVIDWIIKFRSTPDSITVDSEQKDADQRDLQHACAKLDLFLKSADLLPDHVVAAQLTDMVKNNRAARLKAFVAKSVSDIIRTKSIPVQYDQLPHDRFLENKTKSGLFKKNKSGCFNI